MSKLYSKCHKLYSLSKTSRFELKPIGKTKENFENYILTSDEEKSEKFKKVKLYCDEYHKKFINDCLENFQNDKFIEVLNKYYELYIKNNRSDKETYRTQYLKDDRINDIKILGKVVGLMRAC